MAVENKFWRSPDLVSQLIPFLDVASILALATVQPLVTSLIQRRFIWKDLIGRSTICGSEQSVDNRKRNVGELVEILKLVADPEPHLLELLHTICEKWEHTGSVQVSCNLHPSGHKVDTDGFELLELVEATMGTTLQKVEEIDLGDLNENLNSDFSLASALVARINRQSKPLQKAIINRVVLLANTGITANLLQNTQEWEVEAFLLQRDFGREGWSWLAGHIQRNKDALGVIHSSALVMARAKREDLKAVWDENQSCEWWLLEHSRGALPRDSEEWGEWTTMFSQYPTDGRDILFGRSAFEENEEEDEEILVRENGDPAWRNFEASLRIKIFDTLTTGKLKFEIQ